ncbi:hypothetical protein HQ590_12795, partial [bacterium]|nr:hypothetical protein [bacterium]
MKADWIKRNLVTVLFVVVFLGLLGYSCLRLQQAIARRRQVVADLEAERIKFNGLRSGRPFPSPDNLNTLREDHARLKALYGELVDSLRRPVEVPEFNRVELAENLAQRLTEMTARVRRAEVNIPAHFAFGFD